MPRGDQPQLDEDPVTAESMSPKSQQAESARPAAHPAGTLMSVNVGMPEDVPWQGKTVFTGVFKDPVAGPRRVRKLNVDGDGQGDLAGHGGEQRAVFVYQIESYRYWEGESRRDDFVHGQFGENFTVEGLADDEVCIGDRYQIGTAVFEVTQPRVTCYRVGIRMNDPRIPALLVSHRRPGFYFRVLQGRGRAGRRDRQAHPRPGTDDGRRGRCAPLPARAPAPAAPPSAPPNSRAERWLAGFVPRPCSKESPVGGNAGLTTASPPPAWPGFRRLTVTVIERESDSVISIRLEDPDGAPLPAARPGQYLTLRVQPDDGQRAVLRNYSLRDHPMPATTGSPSSANTTAPPAAICTPGSPSATNSTSPRRGAPSSSIGRMRPCC